MATHYPPSKVRLTLTPEWNVKDNQLIDKKLVSEVFMDGCDTIMVRRRFDDQATVFKINVDKCSVHDDSVMNMGFPFVILHYYSEG